MCAPITVCSAGDCMPCAPLEEGIPAAEDTKSGRPSARGNMRVCHKEPGDEIVTALGLSPGGLF
jgi:hypothetical protein